MNLLLFSLLFVIAVTTSQQVFLYIYFPGGAHFSCHVMRMNEEQKNRPPSHLLGRKLMIYSVNERTCTCSRLCTLCLLSWLGKNQKFYSSQRTCLLAIVNSGTTSATPNPREKKIQQQQPAQGNWTKRRLEVKGLWLRRAKIWLPFNHLSSQFSKGRDNETKHLRHLFYIVNLERR